MEAFQKPDIFSGTLSNSPRPLLDEQNPAGSEEKTNFISRQSDEASPV